MEIIFLQNSEGIAPLIFVMVEKMLFGFRILVLLLEWGGCDSCLASWHREGPWKPFILILSFQPILLLSALKLLKDQVLLSL